MTRDPAQKHMHYRFKNKALYDYLSRQSRSSFNLPKVYQRAAFALAEEVRGYDFRDTASDGQIHVSMFEHSLDEVCGFVDWSVDIWNQTSRELHRSRKLTTKEFLDNKPFRDGETPLESLIGVFESWYEISEVDEGPYISLQKYPSPAISIDPFATVGNLCAAVGLAVLDNLAGHLASATKDSALNELGLAWEFAMIARRSNHIDMAFHFESESRRVKMVRAANAKHDKDPKQAVKRQVRELWQLWEVSSTKYPSIAAFARDMCDKWPDLLTSEVVVSRWVRDWKRASHQ